MAESFSLRFFSFTAHAPAPALNDRIGYHDLTLCLSGKMEYFIDGTAYVLTKGDCLYMPPGSRRIRIGSNSPTSYASINLFGQLEEPLPTTFFPQYLSSQIMQILELIRMAHSTHCDAKVLYLSQYLLCDLQEICRRSQENPIVLTIKNYILQNIYRKITVDDAISQAFLSKDYCQSLFKQKTGMSIVTFINKEKIELAKPLIACQHSLTSVASMLGFDDYNYFSRVFKKYTGLSPLKYRQAVQKKDLIPSLI